MNLRTAVAYLIRHSKNPKWYNLGYIHGMRMSQDVPEWLDSELYKNRTQLNNTLIQDVHDLWWYSHKP